MHFGNNETLQTMQTRIQLQMLVGACQALDRADAGVFPLPPALYQSIGGAARVSMQCLLQRDISELTEAVARLANYSNAAHELFEAEWVSQVLIEVPDRMPELSRTLAKAKAKDAPQAGTPKASTLTLLCRQEDDRDNLHVSGLSCLDADSRRIVELMTSVVAQPTATVDGFELNLSTGMAKPLAQMMATALTVRKVAVRVA